MATNAWLDGLSEEWVEQPRSSSSAAPSPASTSAKHAPITATPGQSRIPRMRKFSSSIPTNKSPHINAGSGIDSVPKTRSVLAERSLSDENMRPGPSPSPTNQKTPRSRLPSRSVSAASIGSVLHDGTVDQKPRTQTPSKAPRKHDTPEWRRRLLKGQMAYQDQKDLFSPMGLEQIFNQPQKYPAKPTPHPKATRNIVHLAEVVPSSPPPWSSSKNTRNKASEEESAIYHDSEPEDFTADQSIFNEHAHPNAGHLDSLVSEQQEEPSSLLSNARGSRTASGETEMHAENFSPVYISKHNTLDGRVAYAALERSKSDIIAGNRSGQTHDNSSNQCEETEQPSGTNVDGSSFAKIQDETLPADLPVGTPEVVANLGRFVSMKRGGYSADGSFQKRPLSSTPPVAHSVSRVQVLAEASSEDVYQQPAPDSDADKFDDSLRPAAPSPPVVASTPFLPTVQRENDDRSRSSGSPLKLFGNHDTFTANRLHRRLSQLELHETAREVHTTAVREHQQLAPRADLSAVEETSNQELMIHETHTIERTVDRQFISRRRSFGSGAYDDYKFPEDEFSLLSDCASNEPGSLPDNGDASPGEDLQPPGSKPMFQFRLDESPSLKSRTRSDKSSPKTSRQTSKTGTSSFGASQLKSPKLRNRQAPGPDSNVLAREENSSIKEGGKRPPTSPAKNPTPKRRRTLHREEASETVDAVTEEVKEQSTIFQSIIGRKRKDARHGMSNNMADLETLAKRQILRPRNPTPSQRRREQIQAEIIDATEAFMKSSPPRLNAIREDIDATELLDDAEQAAQAKAVANEVAAFTLRINHAMKDDSRKKSVTTQDFLDEAMKIMEFIRTKGRPMSGLGSLEESESEEVEAQASHLLASPSGMTFSRPASRNGPPSGWRNPQQQQLNPEMADQLQRYKEGSSEFMASSMHSLHASQTPHNMSPSIRDGFDAIDKFEQNDIRIHEAPKSYEQSSARFDHPDSVGTTQDTQTSTQRTHPSYTSSAGRSTFTNASKLSENVATLAPEAVAHLIPEEVAGMSFDREKGVWVRKRSPVKERPSELTLNESEEDPFENIPDLTIDEVDQSRIPVATQDVPIQVISGTSRKDFVQQWAQDNPPESSRPQTREESKTFQSDLSTVTSRPNQFTSSTDPVETRATSWSEEEMRARSKHGQATQDDTMKHVLHAEEVEHEILINEGRTRPLQNAPKIRDVTITFSSPLISRYVSDTQIQHFDGVTNDHDAGDSILGEEASREPTKRTRTQSQRHSSLRSQTLRSQVDRHRILSKTIPMISEVEEMSMITDHSDPRQTRYSVNLSGAVTRADQEAALIPPPSPAKGDVTFYLSDLPDFSLNQVDERELPGRVIAKRNGESRVEDRFGQGTAELVKALQDEEPNEPYWEDLRSVDLASKSLTTLHRLNAFCWCLEEADVSGNALNEVHGAPSSIRRFSVRDNCLSSLTSWGHLMNLQYLDVSGNDIDDLTGFACLLHLRELRADDNRIVDISGINGLDGLIRLSVRRNRIRVADFQCANLKCVEEIDMSDNEICEIDGLLNLPKLQTLILDNNHLATFPTADQASKTSKSLRSLRICGNQLTSLRVTPAFPQLESLHADCNRLDDVDGLDQLRHLHTFSCANQGNKPLAASSTITAMDRPMALLQVPFGLTHLRLSTNAFTTLTPPRSFYLLQRLELAECALQCLPAEFGHLVPNLRYLNLNFNGLKDLSPLLNTKALSELHVAGNRLARLRKNMAVVARLTDLQALDMRDNPLTVGFYGPTVENRLVAVSADQDHGEGSAQADADPLTLPMADSDADSERRLLLDNDTKLRRRVFEMLLAHSNPLLKTLDGLSFDAKAATAKDEVFERLKMLGVLRKVDDE